MSPDISFAGTLATLSIIILIYILAKLSERLGSVEKMEPIYRHYYTAMIFWGIGFLAQVLAFRTTLSPQDFPDWLTSPWFHLATHHLPLAIGVTIAAIVTWRYWSWILTQYNK